MGADDLSLVAGEDELREALVRLMGARRNLRAIEADTGVSETTIADLRNGRGRVTPDVLRAT